MTETFVIGVHDHTSHEFQGANSVTIRIYFDKQMVWSGVKEISGEDTFVPFAEVDTATGTVKDL